MTVSVLLKVRNVTIQFNRAMYRWDTCRGHLKFSVLYREDIFDVIK